MDKIEKGLLKQTLVKGLIGGVVWSLLAFLTMTSAIENFFSIMLLAFLLVFIWEFFSIYRVNLKIHLKFKKKYGKKYINLVEEELGKNGISNMLKKKWFFEREKQDKKDEFIRG